MKDVNRSKKRRAISMALHNVPKSYPWDILKSLSLDLTHYLTDEESEKLSKIIRYKDLGSYLNLSQEWGLQCIDSTDTVLAKVRAKYLLCSVIKKYQFPTDKTERVARATEIFLAAEGTCKSYNQVNYKSLTDTEDTWSSDILLRARQFLVKLLGSELPGSKALLDTSRHGPGSTIGTTRGDVSMYHKYGNWPYSCTIEAHRYARFAIETDRRWLGALQDSYRMREGIPAHMPLDMKRFWAKVINVVDGNRIAFVPKDAQKERTIAIEPTLNLYLQLGVDGFIRKRLKRFGVDLDSQVKNQELARRGSLVDGEESHVTIDLSAASDSISLKLCELLLPRDWFRYLCDLRSPYGELECEGDRTLIKYEKISSMGNGFTFALESALFTALVWAVQKVDGDRFDRDDVAIYGDDIVIKRRYYFKLVEALRLAGFTTNTDKTFVYGPARESCGADWFQGKPVRPVFVSDLPTTVMELFCDLNRLKRLLSLRFGIGDESTTLGYIRSLVPERALTLIGPYSDEDFDSYIHSSMPRRGMYKNCMYKFRRIVIIPTRRPGKDFLMRKLMHDLRGKQLLPTKWEKKLPGSGSRFTVTRRNANTVGYTYSHTDNWCDSYAELIAKATEYSCSL